jgi:P-type E1-E2 ATPase
MIRIEVPGRAPYELEHVVLDFNGTIAEDGRFAPGVAERLERLSRMTEVHVLTADTHGTAAAECAGTGASVETFPTGAAEPEKLRIVRGLVGQAFCVGNGANDAAMCDAAALSVAVVGKEGAAAGLLGHVDVVTTSIADALDLVLVPERLVATLRW